MQSFQLSLSFSLLFLPTFFFVFFIFLVFFQKSNDFLTRNKSSSKVNLPPSPSNKLPIIGHLQLLTKMPHHSLAHLSQTLGPIIHLQLGRVPTIVISSPELAKLVLKTHDQIFSNRPSILAAKYLSFNSSDISFSPYGAYWRQVRKICVTKLLSSKQVNSFELVRDEEMTRLLSSISESAKCGREIDLSKLVFGLANDVLCRVAFGKRFKEGLEGQKGNLVEVLSETQNLFGGFCVGDFFPEWGWVNILSGDKRRFLRNLKDLRRIGDVIIDEHVKRRESEKKRESIENGRREDFVDVLLRIREEEDLEVPITDDNLKALVLDLFVAGTDSTSATIQWAIAELIKKPKTLHKAQSEVRQVVSPQGKVLEQTHLQHLHYLNLVIKETLRLHPAVPLMVPRESMEKCTLSGYEIPAKTRVIINGYAIQRDEKWWENPSEFIPERFEAKNIDFKDPDFKYLPFGGGRRGCPGYTFGVALVEVALAKLLYHFDWELPNGVGEDDVDLEEAFGLSITKRSALVLVPRVNKDYEFKEDLYP